MSTWNELWNANFQRLDEDEVKLWEEELLDGPNKIYGLTQDELCSVIRRMVDDPDVEKYPKMKTLRYYIFAMRKNKLNGAPNGQAMEFQDTKILGGEIVKMSELMRLIRVADSDEMIWNYICRPCAEPHCMHLERYAMRVHKDFDPEVMRKKHAEKFSQLIKSFLNKNRNQGKSHGSDHERTTATAESAA